jgi:alanine dehydrogenase
MKIGVPAEVKNHEYRVAITPSGAHELVRSGHEVVVQHDAGAGSSIPDADFVAAGARIMSAAADVWQAADLILKVRSRSPGNTTGCARTGFCSPTCTWRRRRSARTR